MIFNGLTFFNIISIFKLLEVCPLGLSQLQVGTRVCGYWSRKSRCLYPGFVSNIHPATPLPPNASTNLINLTNVSILLAMTYVLTSSVTAVFCHSGHRSVAREDEIDVEFDDGDSGRIPVSQIRLLPPDYPVLGKYPIRFDITALAVYSLPMVPFTKSHFRFDITTERDPNPLLPIESRRHKRRISEPASATTAQIPVAAVKPSVHKEAEGMAAAAEVDEPAEKKNKKTEGDESKENNDDGNVQLKKCRKSKKHKKKHKKKRQIETSDELPPVLDQPDLIIPISPGLAIDHALEGAAADDSEPIVKMETRGSKEAVNYSGMSPIRSSF